MFDGEKTNLFWVGLLVLGFSSLFLFNAIWLIIVNYVNYQTYSISYRSSVAYSFDWSVIPTIVGGLVFMLIGLYMMKSGVKKTNLPMQAKAEL